MDNFGMSELMLILSIVVAVLTIVNLLPFWFIFRKAGFPPALSLLMAIPFVEIVMKYYLAFAKWPSLKKQAE